MNHRALVVVNLVVIDNEKIPSGEAALTIHGIVRVDLELALGARRPAHSRSRVVGSSEPVLVSLPLCTESIANTIFR